jgi:hypothetical protein
MVHRRLTRLRRTRTSFYSMILVRHTHLLGILSLSLFAFVALPAQAQAPRKTSRDIYHYLSWCSPFTANRHAEPPVTRNHAENLCITGMTKFPDGYFIVLEDRTDPKKTLIIQPGVPSPVEILDISDASENIQLHIKYLGETARIGFTTTKKTSTKPTKSTLPTPP